MQAIQIKYLAGTKTLPARLKASSHAGAITEVYEYEGVTNQALALAERYIREKQWPVYITGRGVLANSDEVFTIDRKVSE